jgi:hypothetical protein
VKRYCAVAAAAHALGHGVVDVLLVPEVVRHMARDEVVLRYKRKEPSPTQGVSAQSD